MQRELKAELAPVLNTLRSFEVSMSILTRFMKEIIIATTFYREAIYPLNKSE